MKKLILVAFVISFTPGLYADYNESHYLMDCYDNLLKVSKSSMNAEQSSKMLKDSERLIANLGDSKDGVIPSSMKALNACTAVPSLKNKALAKAKQLYPGSVPGNGGSGAEKSGSR